MHRLAEVPSTAKPSGPHRAPGSSKEHGSRDRSAFCAQEAELTSDRQLPHAFSSADAMPVLNPPANGGDWKP